MHILIKTSQFRFPFFPNLQPKKAHTLNSCISGDFCLKYLHLTMLQNGGSGSRFYTSQPVTYNLRVYQGKTNLVKSSMVHTRFFSLKFNLVIMVLAPVNCGQNKLTFSSLTIDVCRYCPLLIFTFRQNECVQWKINQQLIANYTCN